MKKDICFIENYDDIDLVTKKVNTKNILFIPLNLETYVFCKKKNYDIFNFKKNISENFHKNALVASENFLNNLSFRHKLNYSLKSEINYFLRFRLNNILFIIEIIEKIRSQMQVGCIIVSGLKKNFYTNISDGSMVTEIVENLYQDKVKIKKLTENKNYNELPVLMKYDLASNCSFQNKNVLLSNAGYNFKRIIKVLNQKKINVWVPFFEKLSIIRKIIYYFRGYKILQLKKTNKKEKLKIYIEKINFNYNSFDLSELLNEFYLKFNYFLNDVDQKSIILKKIINENKISLAISNIAKGYNGSILDHDVNCNTLCVTHGMMTKSYNDYDSIYKKILAEAVFAGESKFFAIQSKIMLDSLNTLKINGKVIKTGNIVFSSAKNKKEKKNLILHAATVKDFSNLQFLGVEMFYEYWESLSILNDIAKKNEFKVVSKPHPNIEMCTKDLKKIFKNIKFSNKPIETLLTKAMVLVSYSSTTIEDALNSKVPVILFYKEKRYIHVKSNMRSNFPSSLNYVSLEKDLIKMIQNIKEKKVSDFDKYIFESNYTTNIEKNILPLINNEKI